MATEDTTEEPPNLDLIAGVAGAGSFAAITVVAYLLLDAPAFGVLAGAMVGLGSYFHLPYFMRYEEKEEWSRASDGGTGLFHTGALGASLDIGGIAALALAFAFDVSVEALAGGVLLALLAYLVLSKILPVEPAS